MAKLKFLTVLPNPWTHIDVGTDSNGDVYAHPAGYIFHDPAIYGSVHHERVGVTIGSFEIINPGRSVMVGDMLIVQERSTQRTRFRYTAEPITVTNNRYYQQEVSQGHLVACDPESAAACGIQLKDFVEPSVLLAKFRAEAIERTRAENPGMPEPSDPLTDAPEAPAAPVAPPPSTTTAESLAKLEDPTRKGSRA